MKTLLTLAAVSLLASAGAPESPFACNRMALDPQQRARHFNELGPKLRALVVRTRDLSNGYEFEFPAGATAYQLIAEWAGGEHLCCPFLDIGIRLDKEGGATRLLLTGRPGTKEFIHSDFEGWFKQ